MERVSWFGELLKQYRTSRGYSYYMVSKLSGISQKAVEEIEEGVRSPHLSTVQTLCKALDIPCSLFRDDLSTIEITPEDEQVLSLFRGLDREKRKAVLEIMKQLNR